MLLSFVNPDPRVSRWIQHPAICCSVCSTHGIALARRTVEITLFLSCVSDLAWPHCEHNGPSLFGTLSLSRCFTKEKHLTPSFFSSDPYVACEGVKLTNNRTDLWEPCVCLSAFPGARSVCAGSEEAEALIKEQAWYRDASLTAWGTCSLMGSR